MHEKKFYSNGQPVNEVAGDILTYFYKNGKIKARGQFISNQMEGEWVFYRETGQLWQIANFRNNRKHGAWIRFDRNDKVEYEEEFADNKIIKKKKTTKP